MPEQVLPCGKNALHRGCRGDDRSTHHPALPQKHTFNVKLGIYDVEVEVRPFFLILQVADLEQGSCLWCYLVRQTATVFGN